VCLVVEGEPDEQRDREQAGQRDRSAPQQQQTGESNDAGSGLQVVACHQTAFRWEPCAGSIPAVSIIRL
jgi:hypothetical protein